MEQQDEVERRLRERAPAGDAEDDEETGRRPGYVHEGQATPLRAEGAPSEGPHLIAWLRY
jgi:hypothetical protein